MHKLIVANYKMSGSKKFFLNIQHKLRNLGKDTEIILCPPFVFLPYFKKNKKILLGAQNVCETHSVASTGQISVDMLMELGVKFAIVGHKELRERGDTNEIINKKIKLLVDSKITPILCVGERDINDLSSISNQIKKDLKGVKNCDIVIAYEPIWAIGTKKSASIERINKVVEIIKNNLNNTINVKIVYGGSTTLKNFKQLLTANIDGLLVHNMALNAETFATLIKGVENE